MLNEKKATELTEELEEISSRLTTLETNCHMLHLRMMKKRHVERISEQDIALKAAPALKQIKADLAKYSRRIKEILKELNDGIQDVA